MTKLISIVLAVLFVLSNYSCTPAISQNKSSTKTPSKEFSNYWYAGEAELNRYELEQARYGEIHKGEAVLIFVTEDFDIKKQVKHERGDRKNVTSVLKLNLTKKFFTGLYPYSMMSSIFTPVNMDRTIKVTTSSQEWCGHTFSQLNLNDNKYKGRLHSYFQSEGDQEFNLEAAILEDELWNTIRLNPASLPTGEIRIVPGTMFLRLKHQDYKIENAIASVSPYTDKALGSKALKIYRLEYSDMKRVLEITFEDEFPHSILAWEEQNTSGFGSNAKLLTTRAVRTHSIKSAYWSKHDLADAEMRKKLGLDMSNY